MKDVQNQRDHRELPINKVGIKGLRYPITVRDRRTGSQKTVASIQMSVELPREFKGTHMSRFIEALQQEQEVIDIRQFGRILKAIREKLNARSAHLDMEFPYFIEKHAPVSGAKSYMDYQCFYQGVSEEGRDIDFTIGVTAPVTTLCPCSKEISDRGAHNQRSFVTMQVRFVPPTFLWIEDLVEMAEEAASSAMYALLKRPDEKFVTERAFDHPRFVEDMVREVAGQLMARPEVRWFRVESENLESIHNHNAFAVIEADKGVGRSDG